MSVEVAIKGAVDGLGEGPHWDDDSQTLLFIEHVAGVVKRWTPATDTLEEVTLGGHVGFVVPHAEGGYVVGHNQSLVHLDWATKTTTTLAQLHDTTETQINDGKCDPAGRVWAGTYYNKLIADASDAVVGAGSLYCTDVSGKVSVQKDKVTISNGLAWSIDNKTMYYIDSYPRKVFAYDYDKESGYTCIKNERVCVDFGGPETVESLGYPDGMTVDMEDKLWVVCFGAGKVIRFDPDTGKELRTITFPAPRTTSCCFGGSNFDELYVTSSSFAAKDDEPKEFAGSVFRVTGLGVHGFRANKYKGGQN